MISISDLRHDGRQRLDLADAIVDVVAGLEAIAAVHETECGCEAPSTFVCAWRGSARAEAIAAFDFDEEVTT